MGHTQAAGMAEAGGVNETTISWHLTVNHYPPLSTDLVGPCLKAIELADNGDWNDEVKLPEGITFRDKETAPVWEMVNTFHLGAFLDVDG